MKKAKLTKTKEGATTTTITNLVIRIKEEEKAAGSQRNRLFTKYFTNQCLCVSCLLNLAWPSTSLPVKILISFKTQLKCNLLYKALTNVT